MKKVEFANGYRTGMVDGLQVALVPSVGRMRCANQGLVLIWDCLLLLLLLLLRTCVIGKDCSMVVSSQILFPLLVPCVCISPKRLCASNSARRLI